MEQLSVGCRLALKIICKNSGRLMADGYEMVYRPLGPTSAPSLPCLWQTLWGLSPPAEERFILPLRGRGQQLKRPAKLQGWVTKARRFFTAPHLYLTQKSASLAFSPNILSHSKQIQYPPTPVSPQTELFSHQMIQSDFVGEDLFHLATHDRCRRAL